jgi:lysophospholipase L1-like esterase
MIKKNSIVLFQGDSITDCGRERENVWEGQEVTYNTGLGTGYAHLIASDLRASRCNDNLNFLNRGISGNRVVDLYARWKSDALNLNPDLISILIGVNDTWHEFRSANGVEPTRYEMMFRMLLTWTKEALPKTSLVLMEPFILPCGAVEEGWEDDMAQRRAIVKKLAGEFGAIFVPLQDLLTEKADLTGPEYWLGDGVHPTPAGHRLIADAWKRAVKE